MRSFGEELHAAVRVVDHEPLARAEQLVGDDQRADRVVARAAAGVADDVRVALVSPAYFAGSRRASMQVRIAKRRAGGRASHARSPNSLA